jgi:dipeptidyl aminopeptidase/acylaminoacyl peptidase
MRSLLYVLAGVVGVASPAPAAERQPVLKEVTAPHSYYWREMYVPQLTSGPSAFAWSRDGKSLYFSMQGRIWRQRLDGEIAEQVTTGAGYDYQPDVSPDGKSLVFARRLGDAVNLVVVELKSGRETWVTVGEAVNVEPRWSPDGKTIAFVTTAESGNFHIALAIREGAGWRSRRWRPESRTTNGRYYYAATDHELSPSWSPDGAELIFVSNEQVQHGTGRIARQRIDLSSPPQIVRDEETNWKARPDWSPDGKRVAYASYLGRQWHQLWLTTATPGGYPMPFTYGDFEIAAPRWSPDGSKIAYVTNEGGGLAIEIIEMIGGARTRLEAKSLKRRGETGALNLSIRDDAGAATPARVQVRGSDGRDYAPDGALIRADDFRDPADPTETHYFQSDGEDVVALPPGPAKIRVWRGLSSTPVVRSVRIEKRGDTDVDIALDDLDGEFARWKSGDVHVHMNYGGAYREDVPGLSRQADAEGLDLAFNLIVNKEQRVPDIASFATTPVRPAGGAVIAQAQEFHTSVWGHLGLIGLERHFLIPDYVGYPKTAVASLYPDNATISRLARAQNALVGYVHPFDPPAPDPAKDAKLTYALPADVALGLVDYLEVVGFADHRTTEAVWHRLLNCGFRIPAAGGTDAMTNYASLRGPIGLDRTYVDLGEAPSDPATFTRSWLDGLKAGRSFATNSALLDFKVEGRGPGADIRLKKGARRLKFSVSMKSIAAIDALEIIVNGMPVQTLDLSADGRAARAEGEIEIAGSSWISLRASSKNASADVFDLYPYAATSPVYVTVDGKAQRSREDADYFIAWIDRLIAFTRESDTFNTENERKRVLANFARARGEFEKRR